METPNTKSRGKKGKLEEWLDNPKRVLVAGAIVGIGGFLTYKLVRFIYSSIRSNSTTKMADDDPNVRAAMTIRTAMNPSGVSWMRAMDMTNDDAIFNEAKNITNLDAVLKAYRKLYDSDMLADIQSELNADEYQKFLNLITSNPNKQGGAAPVVWAAKTTMIVAKKEVTLRKTPDASYHGGFYENQKQNNIITKAGPGAFIGYATGVQQFDSKNNVKFIQAAYIVKKEGVPSNFKQFAGQKRTFWVSASSDYVDLFTTYKAMWERYPATKTAVSYLKPLDYYDPKAPDPKKPKSTVNGLPFRAVISQKPAQVLDEKFQRIADVEPQTLLGSYLGSLNTGNKKYVKFLTVSGTERWADEDNIQIHEL